MSSNLIYVVILRAKCTVVVRLMNFLTLLLQINAKEGLQVSIGHGATLSFIGCYSPAEESFDYSSRKITQFR